MDLISTAAYRWRRCRVDGRLALPAAVLLVLGCGGPDGGGPAATGPAVISILPTAAGERPLVKINACKKTLPPSNAPFGQYVLLVRRDGEPYYQRLVDPEEVTHGSEKDLAIPNAESRSRWSVALERVLGVGESEPVSNSIVFDPLDTSAVAVAPPAPARPASKIEVRFDSEQLVIDGVPVDLSAGLGALEAAIGPPNRVQTGGFNGTMTWDPIGVFARGQGGRVNSIVFVMNPSDFSVRFFPRQCFQGKVVVDGQELNARSGEDAAKLARGKSRKVSAAFKKTGEIEFVEISP